MRLFDCHVAAALKHMEVPKKINERVVAAFTYGTLAFSIHQTFFSFSIMCLPSPVLRKGVTVMWKVSPVCK